MDGLKKLNLIGQVVGDQPDSKESLIASIEKAFKVKKKPAEAAKPVSPDPASLAQGDAMEQGMASIRKAFK
jgi:hypothetical protein